MRAEEGTCACACMCAVRVFVCPCMYGCVCVWACLFDDGFGLSVCLYVCVCACVDWAQVVPCADRVQTTYCAQVFIWLRMFFDTECSSLRSDIGSPIRMLGAVKDPALMKM